MEKHEGKYAWTVKVGEKGQIVIPKEARNIFDINPGDTLIILGDKEQGLGIPPKDIFTKLVNTIFDGNMPQRGDEE
ncbi:AbrB/MazE/SpoVT family DNA-binding domain-containing protein [Enterococcus faecium]|uniref:AbrB/MazE/SpoVT family DNA-binding domain-containing protein n=1 Tax=Enterococcus faecium TaxID=1352 RepID=UPI002073B1BA|nr:AbrB/MazE/SpoVT family DNA-binding domain-containing protein [Enterococcus faecium]MCM6878896.1 AbrB/MazE/SpoVT family DNA-binding domain-containing protein [Enterococcus faecium]